MFTFALHPLVGPAPPNPTKSCGITQALNPLVGLGPGQPSTAGITNTNASPVQKTFLNKVSKDQFLPKLF